MLPEELLSVGNAAVIGVRLPTRLVWEFWGAVLEPEPTDLHRGEAIGRSIYSPSFQFGDIVPSGTHSGTNLKPSTFNVNKIQYLRFFPRW